jgi:hypothetical protein
MFSSCNAREQAQITPANAGIKALASRLRISPAMIAGRIRSERCNYAIHKCFFAKGSDVRELLTNKGLLV